MIFQFRVLFVMIQVNMEKAKEKDDPTGTALKNPGIFMRLKSNILNRLQNAKMYLDNERNTDRICGQIEIPPP